MQEDNLHRIMAIDYGSKRIGIALSDPLFTFSYPFSTLNNDPSIWKNIASIISDMSVNLIILGYPLNTKGELTETTREVLKFKNELERRTNTEILLWDERYSSGIAQQHIIESVPKKSKRRDKGLLDRNSAAVILQEYLDSR